MHPIILQFQEIVQGSYPEWIWKRSPKRIADYVPVFMFHTVQPDSFEAQLLFLKSNDYQTITTESLYRYIKYGEKHWDQAVMLTFDDGRKSVWSVAFPLLKKYEMQATVFLSPGIMDDSDRVSYNLDDVWQGRTKSDLIIKADQADFPTLTWKEIQHMHCSGLVDFQCHSFLHQRISVGPKIVNFVSPEIISAHYFKFGIPYYPDIIPGKTDQSAYMGAPVYQSAPSLSGYRMFIEDDLRKHCIAFVINHGGIHFFDQPEWKKILKKNVNSYRKTGSKYCFESEDEQKKRITAELIQARQTIESHLTGHTVRYLAYPWGTGSDVAVQCSREAGYTANFWSVLPGRSKNQVGSDLFHLVRLKHDFIWRLPGKGRYSLFKLGFLKLKRRIKGQIDY
ncbi:polysaccharide deacetylase family protein [bacterium]|nr:polysaccharide deacetylase family protein [bacterium]